jgi:hypothetical protein
LTKTGFSKIAKGGTEPLAVASGFYWQRLPTRYRERFCTALSSARFEPEHENKASRHLAQRLLLALAVVVGRVADAAAEKRAEGSKTLKTDFKTHLSHAESLGTKQFFGFLNSSLDQVLVWGGCERVAKQTEEMVTRQTGLL